MPFFRQLEILCFALVALVGLLLWDHRPRPTYETFLGPRLNPDTVVEILSREGLNARVAEDGGIEVRKGEKDAAILALVRDPRFSPGY